MPALSIDQARANCKAKLRARIENLNRRMRGKLTRAQARSQQAAREHQAKVEALQQKADREKGDAKTVVEARIAKLREASQSRSTPRERSSRERSSRVHSMCEGCPSLPFPHPQGSCYAHTPLCARDLADETSNLECEHHDEQAEYDGVGADRPQHGDCPPLRLRYEPNSERHGQESREDEQPFVVY